MGSATAQSPQNMSYQAVLRNSSNALVQSANVGMQISILQGSADGTAVYVERQFPSTNANGLVNTQIGSGTVISGDFAAIDWANGPYFIKTETDLNGGANYTITGTSQFLSVPYAFYAETCGSQGLKGETGADGKDGANGLSTYDLWKAQAGNDTKTEADYFVAIKGIDGKDGLTTTVNGVEQVNGAITLTKKIWVLRMLIPQPTLTNP